uniref:Uncharacterized protein n=1 Tax=Glossina palpalis gambiensis TaxID=67801 RepID=A0A1B0ANT9_9MUSC
MEIDLGSPRKENNLQSIRQINLRLYSIVRYYLQSESYVVEANNAILDVRKINAGISQDTVLASVRYTTFSLDMLQAETVSLGAWNATNFQLLLLFAFENFNPKLLYKYYCNLRAVYSMEKIAYFSVPELTNLTDITHLVHVTSQTIIETFLAVVTLCCLHVLHVLNCDTVLHAFRMA